VSFGGRFFVCIVTDLSFSTDVIEKVGYPEYPGIGTLVGAGVVVGEGLVLLKNQLYA
jgi:hypothetical protein